MKQGAFDYLVKPVDLEQLSQVLERRLRGRPPDAASRRAARRARPATRSSAAARSCRRCARPSAGWPRRTSTCSILGESGTGKELVARALYQHSRRAEQAVPGHQLRGHSRSRCWRASCSATSRGPSPGPIGSASASSSSATAARSSSTRSATCRRPCRPRCCRVLQDQRFERLGGNETMQTQRARAGGDQPGPGAAGGRGALPRGPLLSSEGGDHPRAAPARAPRGRGRTGPLLPVPLQPRAGDWTCGASRRRRWSCWQNTPGRATCANCRASSSRRCSTPPGTSCCRSSCRMDLRGREPRPPPPTRPHALPDLQALVAGLLGPAKAPMFTRRCWPRSSASLFGAGAQQHARPPGPGQPGARHQPGHAAPQAEGPRPGGRSSVDGLRPSRGGSGVISTAGPVRAVPREPAKDGTVRRHRVANRPGPAGPGSRFQPVLRGGRCPAS